MKKKIIILVILLILLSVGIGLFLTMPKSKKEVSHNVPSQEQKQSEIKGPPITTQHIQITNEGLLPARASARKGEFIVFENKTDADLSLSLKGAVDVNELPVMRGKAAGSPIFGKTGEVNVYNAQTKEKIGSLTVSN